MAAIVSGVAFDTEEATRVVDMVDNASTQELNALNGIGKKTAQRIIDGRPYRGQTEALRALDEVAYVGPAILRTLLSESQRAWCALDDGRQSCCVELECQEGATLDSVTLSVDEVHTLLDWANRAGLEQLDAVCGVGPSIALSIRDARPLHSISDVLDVPRIGNRTLLKIMGRSDTHCGNQGSVDEQWCGSADAACMCTSDSPPADSFVLDEDAVFSLAEETAGQFSWDNSDFIWEEYCQGQYDESAGYDEIAVMDICYKVFMEPYFIAAIEASVALVGIEYRDEDTAIGAVSDYVESVFFEHVSEWIAGFSQIVDDQLR